MTDHRFIDITDEGVYLHAESERLCLERRMSGDTKPAPVKIPFADLDAVVFANDRITVSAPALAGLAKSGCGVVVCDDKHLPVGMFLPLTGNVTQAERFRAQAAAPLPLRKRLWQKIVKAKIHNQGALLRDLTGNDAGLSAMSAKVKSGDPENYEAQAAARYWKHIFAPRAAPFIRQRENDDENALLNYGYAVLRAVTARAIAGSGLHPGLGIYHHNRYDTYCLADDLMEPFRPLVDGIVALHCRDLAANEKPRLNAKFKNTLIFEMSSALQVGRERRTLFDLLARLTGSLAKILLGENEELYLPYLRAPLFADSMNIDVEDNDAEREPE
ncbi:CRISPR-associated endonuclease Cas1 [Planctomycetales bacterium]|nr:CRISPR-associated endonuclease Cas1 [Planctomycetales bacterium]